jgi:hypothetical protein
MPAITEELQQVISRHRDGADDTWARDIYTLKQVIVSRFIVVIGEDYFLNLGDICSSYFNIGPTFVDPLFDPFQHLARYFFIRTDRNEPEYRD